MERRAPATVSPARIRVFSGGRRALVRCCFPALLMLLVLAIAGCARMQDDLADALLRGIVAYFSKNPPLARNRQI